MQMKINDERMIKKKKSRKKKSKLRKRRRKKMIQQNDQISPQVEEKLSTIKDVAKLKTLHIFEPWIKHDELDVRK
jgi:hypothetical protein